MCGLSVTLWVLWAVVDDYRLSGLSFPGFIGVAFRVPCQDACWQKLSGTLLALYPWTTSRLGLSEASVLAPAPVAISYLGSPTIVILAAPFRVPVAGAVVAAVAVAFAFPGLFR